MEQRREGKSSLQGSQAERLAVDASFWTGNWEADWQLRPEEVSGRLEIDHSSVAWLGSFLMSIAIAIGATALPVWLAISVTRDLIRTFSSAANGDAVIQAAGWILAVLVVAGVGLIVFRNSLLEIRLLQKLGMRARSVLVLDDTGFEDRRLEHGKILWSDILKIGEVYGYAHSPDIAMLTMRIRVAPMAHQPQDATLSRVIQILVPPLTIGMSRLKRIMRARCAAAAGHQAAPASPPPTM